LLEIAIGCIGLGVFIFFFGVKVKTLLKGLYESEKEEVQFMKMGIVFKIAGIVAVIFGIISIIKIL